MSLKYDKQLIPRAKALRSAATRHEKRLWYDFLCHYPVRFQRQKTIGCFIVDFYCHAAGLVIELDGSQHFTPEAMQYDAQRTAALQTLQLQILRFTNRDVDLRFTQVCETIHAAVNTRIHQLQQQKEGSP